MHLHSMDFSSVLALALIGLQQKQMSSLYNYVLFQKNRTAWFEPKNIWTKGEVMRDIHILLWSETENCEPTRWQTTAIIN